MNEAQVKDIIIDALEMPDLEVTDICRTPGGLTNTSYFALINGVKYVVRIAGVGTEELINRVEEKANLVYATELGINPRLLYCDTDTGFKITEKIDGALTVTPKLAREADLMKQILSVFKRLHSHPEPMVNTFKLFELMAHYETLVDEVVLQKLAGLRADIMTMKEVYQSYDVSYVPCHIDPIFNNLVIDKNRKLYLIDWEYSGMFDPLWDIATLAFSLDLQDEEYRDFLLAYFERTPTQEEFQRLLMHTVFQDYLWCLWAYFKDAQGDDTIADARIRFNRANKNIALYKKYFEAEDGYAMLTEQFSS